MAKHREIKEIRLDRITSGAWPPGTAISPEARLAKEFGVTGRLSAERSAT